MSNFLGEKGRLYGDFTTNVPYRICTHFRVNIRDEKKKKVRHAVSRTCVIVGTERGFSLFPRQMEFITRSRQRGGEKSRASFATNGQRNVVLHLAIHGTVRNQKQKVTASLVLYERELLRRRTKMRKCCNKN